MRGKLSRIGVATLVGLAIGTQGVLAIALPGCAEGFLGAGGFLNTVGDGLNSVGSCLSPLEPIDLNLVFEKASVIEWENGSAVIDDAAQPDVLAYLEEQLGQDVMPVYYLPLRFHRIGPLTRGEVIQIEALSDVVDRVALYDAEYTRVPAGGVHDLDGRRRTLQIPITRDTQAGYIRIDLQYPSTTNEPMVRLARLGFAAPPAPRGQTVVLHFGGAELVTFRSGYLIPAQVGAIDDDAARTAATEAFRTVYAPYSMTIVTDVDPPPTAPFSVIHIGPTDLDAYSLGQAETIDTRNAYPDDIAVVDANQIALEIARLFGPETYGRAIGMIAAHEMGHLLGLEHVADADALMTGAQCQGSGVDIERLLRRQLKRAPLIAFSSELKRWVIGYQDARAELLETLGPAGIPAP